MSESGVQQRITKPLLYKIQSFEGLNFAGSESWKSQLLIASMSFYEGNSLGFTFFFFKVS